MNEIILLDGTSWELPVILEAMMDDDFYYGYLGSASLSSSSDKLLNQSPKEYRDMLNGARLDTPALSIGKLIHTAVLEPHKVNTLFVTVDVATKSAKAYKEAKEQLDKGQTLLTKGEYDSSMYVVDALLHNDLVKDMLDGGEFEMPAIGDVSGLPHRGKADILHRGVAVYDLKTTSDIGSFSHSAKRYGYPAQVYIYSTLFGIDYKNFQFIVVDKGSKDIGVFSVSESFYLEGKRLVDKAVRVYTEYFINGEDLDNYIITGEL
jgi:hypothetical protein